MEDEAFLNLDDALIEIGKYIENYRAGGSAQHRPAALGFRLPKPGAI